MNLLRYSLVLLSLVWAVPVAAGDSGTAPARITAALQELEALTERTLESTGVPGIAVVVVHQDQVVLERGWGVREAGRPDRIDAETVFQLASVSKPLTSTLLAVLVGDGKVRWDDRVIDHDPGFRMFDPYVTRELRLRDLLCHRSGLPDHAGDLLEDLGFEREQVLRRLRFQPPDSSFRAGYAYNNFGYSEAGYAAAKALGKPWDELAAERLFGPLGMKSTSYRFADYEKSSNRARLHVRVDGKWTARYTRQPDAQAPAGGASSNLRDLALWLRLLLGQGELDGKQLVSAEALAEAQSPQFITGFSPDEGRMGSYGLGWNVSVQRGGRVVCNHSGEFALGMRSEITLLPSEKLGIVVLSNAAPTGIPEGLTESFLDLVIYGKLQRDWVEFANQKFAEIVQQDRAKARDYSHPPAPPTPALAQDASA
ncbi:MAG: serine hydrolase, partial [Planctomycetaceae bacterium]|nr:serine hydrolase [Planctomycetaceae bacterium]